MIGEAGLLNALYDVGITMNDVNPDYVVVGEGRSYSLDTLTKATNLVLKGAKLIRQEKSRKQKRFYLREAYLVWPVHVAPGHGE